MARIWNIHTETITTSRLEVNTQGLHAYRDAHPKEYLGYFDEDQLLGFANTDIEEDSYYISQLAVDPEYTRKGIASQLLAETIDRAKKAGKSRVELAVQVTNVPAIKLFLSHGFEVKQFSVETDYIPKDLDLSELDLYQHSDRLEFLRLVEYNMVYTIS